MADHGHSERNFSGGYNNYDSRGRKTGHSERNISGGYNHYDSRGRITGHSERNFSGGYNHYDAKGHKTGHSERNFGGGYNHYDAKGHKTGESNRNFSGGYNHSDGCYIATCVYGSYDSPEVRTLRRFRDRVLRNSLPGRAFIRLYYAVSPSVVRYLGGNKAFRNFWRRRLDTAVRVLKEKGFEDTPYGGR